MIDLNKYPGMNQALEEDAAYNVNINNIDILTLTESDATAQLAEMMLFIKASCSISIPLRNRAKRVSNYYFKVIKKHVNYYVEREALSQMKMSEAEMRSAAQHLDSWRNLTIGCEPK